MGKQKYLLPLAGEADDPVAVQIAADSIRLWPKVRIEGVRVIHTASLWAIEVEGGAAAPACAS